MTLPSLAVAFLAAALLGGAGVVQSVRLADAGREIGAASDDVEELTDAGVELLKAITAYEAAQRGYLLVGRAAAAPELGRARAWAFQSLHRVQVCGRRAGVRDDALSRVDRLVGQRAAIIDRSVELAAAGRRTEALALVGGGEGGAVMMQIESSMHALDDAARRKLRDAEAAEDRAELRNLYLQRLLFVFMVASFGVAAMSAILGRNAARRSAEALLGANRELSRARAEAERANASKSRFLAAASHDARQPLHALSLYLAALVRRVETEEARRILGAMEAAVRAMTRTFAALLDMARIEAGQIRPQPVVFPIGDLLADLVAQAGEGAAGEGSRIRLASTALMVRSDPDLLEIVLRNLLVNALKYSGGGPVLVGCRRTGDCVRIEVHDTGPGIADEELQSLFRDYVRGSSAGSIEGEGLGLAIADRVCKLLGHPLRVRSRIGSGSTFSVTAPRATVAGASQPSVPAADLAGVRILVADEDAMALEAMRGALEDAGAEVSAARSGADLRAAAARSYDLYVIDVRVGGESGLELLREIRAQSGPQVHALLTTASTSREHLNALREQGCRFVVKPASADELTSAAAAALADRV